MKPEPWQRFLEQIAVEYNFRGRLKRIFLTRFAYNNWNKKEREAWELAQAPGHETFKKQMSQIYARFAADRPEGCPDLKSEDRGSGKFEVLRDWLRETEYRKIHLFYVKRPPVESDAITKRLF